MKGSHSSHNHNSGIVRAAGGLIAILSVLNVVLIKQWHEAVPIRDLIATAVLLGSVVLISLSWSIVGGGGGNIAVKNSNKDSAMTTTTRSPESSLHLLRLLTISSSSSSTITTTSSNSSGGFDQLIHLEVLVTLIVPWMLLVLRKSQDADEMAGYLLAPHLQFFQSQVIGEAILYAMSSSGNNNSSSNRTWIFPYYSCLANAYRMLPLATWLMRSAMVVMNTASISSQTTMLMMTMDLWDPTEWLLVVIIPLSVSMLWIYNSFVILPTIGWHQQNRSSAAAAAGASSCDMTPRRNSSITAASGITSTSTATAAAAAAALSVETLCSQ